LQLQKNLICNHTYNWKKFQIQQQQKLGNNPTQLKKSQLQSYLQVATIINNDNTIICALCNNRIGGRIGRPRGSWFTSRTNGSSKSIKTRQIL
jgi:DUF1365 family protein